MNRSYWLSLILIGLSAAAGLLGCQQRPAVPTIPVQPTEPVVIVVVTATSQPTLAPSKTPEATITPLPTLTPVVTETVTATVGATAIAQATRPPVTAAPPQPSEVPTAPAPEPSAAPSSFPAPTALAPEGQKFSDGNTLNFEFGAVGPLAPDQCYRIDMTLANPTGPGGVGDYWVGLCGNQSGVGNRLRFQVKSARFRDEPNYGTLLVSADSVIPPTPEYAMQWFVTVVRLVDASDPIHPKVEALSAASAALQNSFFR